VAGRRSLTLLLPKDAYERLQGEARRRGVLPSAVVEEVVREALGGRSIRLLLDDGDLVVVPVSLPEDLFRRVVRVAEIAGLSAPKMIAGIVTHWARSQGL